MTRSNTPVATRCGRAPATLVLAALVGLCMFRAPAGAEGIVNDRTLDPIGTAQYRPTLALVTGTSSHVNHLVCMWEQRKPALPREYRVAISGNANLIPDPTWVQQGGIPAPAGYDWLEDLKIGSSGAGGPDPGTFVIVGQIRSNAGAPYTNGIASIRGHVADENTLTWETPQIIETFGSSNFVSVIFDVLYLHVAPGSPVAYLSYANGQIANNYIGWWYRRSSDLGQSWSAPLPAPGDSTANGALLLMQSGETPAVVLALMTPYLAPDRQFVSFTSLDSGKTFPVSEVIGTVPVDYMRSPHLMINSTPVTEYDRIGTLVTGSFFALTTPPMLHTTTFPDVGSSPAVVEVEANNHAAQATAAAPGAVLRGIVSPGSAPADTDFFAFTLSAAQSLMAVCDSSSSTSLAFTMFGADGHSVLTRTQGTQTSSELDFTAPTTDVYYLAVSGIVAIFSSAGYRVRTVSTSPPADGSRDQRDAFVYRRRSGIGWSAPVNASAQTTTPAGYDENGGTLKIDLDGFLYAGWYDWTSGGETSRYVLARSADGGLTWDGPQQLNSANSTWTYVSYSLAPSSIFGPEEDVVTDGRDLFYVWTDVRNGDGDIYSRAVHRGLQLLQVAPSAPAVTPGQVLDLQLTTQNLDDLFKWNLLLTAEAPSRSWPISSANVFLGVGSTADLDLPVAIPDTAAPGTVQMHLVIRSALPPQTIYQEQDVSVTVQPPTAVDAAAARLDLAPVSPNPASTLAQVSFSLSRGGHARLVIYGLDGRVVSRLEDGDLAPGRHVRVWNGTDGSGARVAAGEYFVRLEAEGRSLLRRVVWLR